MTGLHDVSGPNKSLLGCCWLVDFKNDPNSKMTILTIFTIFLVVFSAAFELFITLISRARYPISIHLPQALGSGTSILDPLYHPPPAIQGSTNQECFHPKFGNVYRHVKRGTFGGRCRYLFIINITYSNWPLANVGLIKAKIDHRSIHQPHPSVTIHPCWFMASASIIARVTGISCDGMLGAVQRVRCAPCSSSSASARDSASRSRCVSVRVSCSKNRSRPFPAGSMREP